jgi:hypothetical protein
MRILPVILGMTLLAIKTVLAADDPSASAQADTALEIRSFGEQAQSLLDLLTPFLANFNFSEAKRYPTTDRRQVSVLLQREDGDRVVVLGTFNCLIVNYFANRRQNVAPKIGATDRANRFLEQLKGFLAGLPTPRPAFREVVSSQSWCARGF